VSGPAHSSLAGGDRAAGSETPLKPSGPTLAQRAVLALTALTLVGLLGLLGYAMLPRQGRGFAKYGINVVGQQGRVQPGLAPDFTIALFSGGRFHLAEQRGRVVVINFWASWCPPCREEAPVLERAWRRYRDRGVSFIGIALWDREEDARVFLREFDVSYPNGLNIGGTTAIDYGVTGIPETFVIRPDGTMARHWIGPLTEAQVSAFIEELLDRSG
jgi:cytochrome c biogenesis protein CcmG/thiol:disulfide interchange protein DsbE